MFRTRICWLICTFVAAAIATGCSGQNSNTGSSSEVPGHHLTIRNPRSPALEESGASSYPTTRPHSDLSGHSDHQTPATATPTAVPAQTISLTIDDYISLLRSLSQEVKDRRLIEAAKQGAVGELEALLAVGADAGAADGRGQTGLHWAAEKGHEEAVGRLLAAGAAVDARGSDQWTPLHGAAAAGHAAVVRLLLAAGADHGARDRLHRWTPLHYAAFSDEREAAAALLEGGADREATDNEGKTPLDYARLHGRQQMVELLQCS